MSFEGTDFKLMTEDVQPPRKLEKFFLFVCFWGGCLFYSFWHLRESCVTMKALMVK